MLISSDEALDQVIRFDRTIGYPHPLRDRDSFQRLLGALVDACNRHNVPPDRLVTACLEASKHCPTDFDLLNFAAGLKEIEPWKPAPEIPVSEHQARAIPKSARDSWNSEQRREHDAKWAEFCADVKNQRLAKGKSEMARKLVSLLGGGR